MQVPKFRIIGIKEPGRVNVFLHERFQDVNLCELDEVSLAKLYEDGVPYIQKTPEAVLAADASKPKIDVKASSKIKKKFS
jgi:hypothetical protein